MRGLGASMIVAACLGLATCGGDDGGSGSGASESTSASTSAAEPTSGGQAAEPTSSGQSGTDGESGSATGGEPATRGLPEGVSTWAGQGEIDDLPLQFDVTITNSGGDLTATAKITDNPGLGSPEFALSGTHEPSAGRVALAPNNWIVQPDLPIELIGVEAVYDPEAKTLTGTLVDFAKGSENYLRGGPLTLSLVDGPGEATIRGDESRSLTVGSQTFSGQLQCTGPVRETAGELVYDGAGGLTGSLTVGDPGLDNPIGAFTITGVHNPSTGGITLVPGLWIDDQGTVLTFYVDGTFDPETGSFTGDQWTQIAACPTGTWNTTIQ